ncbi:PREDICTED: protein pygopus-like [Lepidothrix coronata]|uniref:Protein pygopus-like n=1 Tax=Lepidothrix coronata TaxID=321398 RepID=A0A6J0JBD2_9PASS|nr:PREDICTED: protein pygopus-like [Lepidothrix coronata]
MILNSRIFNFRIFNSIILIQFFNNNSLLVGNSGRENPEFTSNLPPLPPGLRPHHHHRNPGSFPDFPGKHPPPPEFRHRGPAHAGTPRERGGAQIPVPVSTPQIQGVQLPGGGDPVGALPAGPPGIRQPGGAGIREQPERPALRDDLRDPADPRAGAAGAPLALQRPRARLPAPGLRLDRRHRPRQRHRHHLQRHRRPGRLLPEKHRPLDQEFREHRLPFPAFLQHPPGIANLGCGRRFFRHPGRCPGPGAEGLGMLGILGIGIPEKFRKNRGKIAEKFLKNS